MHSGSVAVVCACALAAALLLRAFTFTTAGLDWDESLYVVIAQRWLHGGIPYVAVWDQHPMGLPALIALGQMLIGDGLVAARLLALVAVCGTTVLLYAIALYHGERLAGWLAAAIYLLYMTRPDGLAANTEVINNFVVTGAALLLMNAARSAATMRAGPLFAAALLFGIGLQMKYVVVPEAVLLCCLTLAFAWRSGMRVGRLAYLAGLAVMGGILPTAVATLYFWRMGALQPYLDANLLANAAYFDIPLDWHTILMRLRFGLLPISALLPWPFLLAFVMRRAPAAARVLGLWLVVWLIAAAFDVSLPMKFWKHYFNALLPPLSIIMALTVVLIARQLKDQWMVPILTTSVAVVALPAILLVVKHTADSRSIDRPNVPRMVADEIKRVGTNGHDVYVFNYDPLVYSYADAAPPMRFVLGIELADFNVSSGARSIQEIGTALRRGPEWIVVADPSPYAFSPSVLKLLETTLQDYQLDRSWRENDYIQPPIEVRLYHRTYQAQQREPSLTGISSSVRLPTSPDQVRAPVN